MTAALVEGLGVEAPGGSHAFPAPAAMATSDESFYRNVVRARYRGPYLKTLAEDVATGRIDLEQLNGPELPDVGRYSRLVLDSWARPTYLKLAGARSAKDATIERRFKRYGEWAGLAFWLYLTRDWVEEGLPV